MRNHDQSGTVRQSVVVRAHHVLHRVLRRAEHVVASQRVSQRHVRACLAVLSVGVGLRQVLGNQLNSLQRKHLAHRVLVLVNHTLGSVEEGVHALIGRELWRHTHHQVAVNHRDCWEHRDMEHARLLLQLVVRDDREHIHLRARASRCGDGDERSAGVLEVLVTALLREGIVPDVAVVHHHQRYALGAVHHRTAAQRHHEVAAVLACLARAVHHVVVRRVGPDLVKQHVLHASRVQLAFHGLQIAEFLHRCAVARCNQRLSSRHLLQMQVLQLSCAEQYLCRHKKLKIVHTFFIFIRYT